MDVAGRRADEFAHAGKKRDYIVLGLLLDFIDSANVEIGLFLYGGEVFRRNNFSFAKRLANREFDVEPLAVFVFGCPDAGHRRIAVTIYHYILP